MESSEESGANLKHWLELVRGGHAYRELDSPEWICPETVEFERAVDASKEAAGGGMAHVVSLFQVSGQVEKDPSFWDSVVVTDELVKWIRANPMNVAVRNFTREERNASSTLREMMGVLWMVRCYGPTDWAKSTVRLRCDNRACEFIIVRGSRV